MIPTVSGFNVLEKAGMYFSYQHRALRPFVSALSYEVMSVLYRYDLALRKRSHQKSMLICISSLSF
jgi:hypothetical protein